MVVFVGASPIQVWGFQVYPFALVDGVESEPLQVFESVVSDSTLPVSTCNGL